MDMREPRYQWGQPVVARIDLINDGSYPECEPAALLAAAGERGEIVQVGALVEQQVPVYLVSFPTGRVVGCLEEEIGAV